LGALADRIAWGNSDLLSLRKETPLRQHVRVFQRRFATALGLAAILAGLAAPLLGAGRSSAPAQPAPELQQFVFDGEQFDSADGLPVEDLDVETLRHHPRTWRNRTTAVVLDLQPIVTQYNQEV
jgi:hypothetical protein